MNRQVNFEKELRLADVMSDNISKDPAELGVPQRLCLDEKVRAYEREVPFFYAAFSYDVTVAILLFPNNEFSIL